MMFVSLRTSDHLTPSESTMSFLWLCNARWFSVSFVWTSFYINKMLCCFLEWYGFFALWWSWMRWAWDLVGWKYRVKPQGSLNQLCKCVTWHWSSCSWIMLGIPLQTSRQTQYFRLLQCMGQLVYQMPFCGWLWMSCLSWCSLSFAEGEA